MKLSNRELLIIGGWLSEMGLEPDESCYPAMQFYGHERRWRITDTLEIQMAESDFDRWANSVECSEHLPRKRKDVERLVRKMIAII